MRYLKMPILMALSLASLFAFAGAASATILTDAPVPGYTGIVKAESEGALTLHGPISIFCKSSIEGNIERHGSGITTEGSITSLTLTECGSNHATVKSGGSLEVHTEKASENGNGTLTSTGAQISINITSLGITCVYTTFETDIGILTGSSSTNGTAKVDLEGSLPRTGGSLFCGSSAQMTGSYKITTPDYLDVD